MRTLMLCFALAITAAAQSRVGTISKDTPQRGMPKADAPECGTIAKGTSVIIHHDEGDWYAIQPPRGSVSWIGHLFLEFPDKAGPFPKNAVVRSEGDVKLAVGKAGLAKPLDVRKTAVPDGTIVLVIGNAVKGEADRTTWYPIISPEDDFRYLLKSAVEVGGSNPPGFVVKSPVSDTPPPLTVPASMAGPTPVGKPGWPNHPLWLQAEQAESAGDLDKAEKLFFQLAREMNGPSGDGELANQCYSRIHIIREKRRSKQSKDHPTTDTWKQAEKPIQPVAYSEESTPRMTESKTVTSEKWTGSGYLRLAGFKVGTKQAYALEDSRGRLMYYAVGDLDKHRNKTVDLFGTMSSPKDLRGVSLVEVTKVDAVK